MGNEDEGIEAAGSGRPRASDGVSRRDFLRWSGLAGLAVTSAGFVASEPAQAAVPSHRSPAHVSAAGYQTHTGEPPPVRVQAASIRPPAVPLAVRQPYLSTWLPSTWLPGTAPQFWQGSRTGLSGIVRVDGVSYLFMGDPKLELSIPNGNHGPTRTVRDFPRALDQTGLVVTPTRSRFELEGGGVALTVEFLSPVEPGDLRRQSIPMSYVSVVVRSADGATHRVQLYLDIDGGWASGEQAQQIRWDYALASHVQSWEVELVHPKPLTEEKQLAAWGRVVWATGRHSELTYQSGQDIHVRQQFVDHGKLDNTSDVVFRAIDDRRPVFGFSRDLGNVGTSPVPVRFVVGQVRTPAISYLGTPLPPLWQTYFSNWQAMLAYFYDDAAAADRRADALDSRIAHDARAAGGTAYEGLCTLALRQAYGATELVKGPDGKPWAFLKEISSDGNVSSVDVTYPASPVWMYLDPAYLHLLLTPLLAYAERGGWPRKFAEHDLGTSYPNAAGHNNGKEENMPVEESGNMLIMTTAYLHRASESDRLGFAKRHYRILKQWADYLVSALPDPGFQNQTDDFAGFIAHSVNLAIKGIVAVGAMAQIAAIVGNADDERRYKQSAKKFAEYWQKHAQDPKEPHLDLTYNGVGGGDGTWGTVYNAFADRLLHTGLVSESIRQEQAAWYARSSNAFGLPLQVPHSYAKSDWELLTAAWLADFPIKQQLIDRVYAYANSTPERVPFSDIYSTVTGDRDEQIRFQARPVQGGMFALLVLEQNGSPAGPEHA